MDFLGRYIFLKRITAELCNDILQKSGGVEYSDESGTYSLPVDLAAKPLTLVGNFPVSLEIIEDILRTALTECGTVQEIEDELFA